MILDHLTALEAECAFHAARAQKLIHHDESRESFVVDAARALYFVHSERLHLSDVSGRMTEP